MKQMVHNMSSQPRGRPSSYELDEVVAKATAVFWQTGREATSVGDIERATGLNRSSLYTSLDGKDGLFERCLEGYVESATSRLLEPALQGSAGLDDLIGLIDGVEAMLTIDDHPAGCFALRSLMRGEGGAAADRYVASLRAAIVACLHRAAVDEGLDPALTAPRAALVEAAVLGMLAVGRTPHHDPVLLAEGVRAQVLVWRETVR
jgi:AcrR family transcriptional regulator